MEKSSEARRNNVPPGFFFFWCKFQGMKPNRRVPHQKLGSPLTRSRPRSLRRARAAVSLGLIACLLGGLTTACARPNASPRNPLRRSQLWQTYRQLPESRAFVVAGDPSGIWVAGAAGGAPTLEEAIQLAAQDCERLRDKRRIKPFCRTYAEGNVIVWWGTNPSDESN